MDRTVHQLIKKLSSAPKSLCKNFHSMIHSVHDFHSNTDKKHNTANSLGLFYCLCCRSFDCCCLASLSRSHIFYFLMGCGKVQPVSPKNLKVLQTDLLLDRPAVMKHEMFFKVPDNTWQTGNKGILLGFLPTYYYKTSFFVTGGPCNQEKSLIFLSLRVWHIAYEFLFCRSVWFGSNEILADPAGADNKTCLVI